MTDAPRDPQPAQTMPAELFRQIAGRWLTGVTVVTSVTSDGTVVGLTMNAVCPLSLSPPQFLACLDLKSDTLAAIRATGVFCINFLRDDQADICKAFARKGSDKFSGVAYRIGSKGAPVIENVLGYVECCVDSIHISGDHAIVVGSACGGEAATGEPLGYYSSGFRALAEPPS